MRSKYAACHSQRVITQDFDPARREEKYSDPEKMKTIAVGETQTAAEHCAGHILISEYCEKWVKFARIK